MDEGFYCEKKLLGTADEYLVVDEYDVVKSFPSKLLGWISGN